jgi:protoheme IX farnesyltransferase
MEKTIALSKNPSFSAKMQDYAQLTKMRLASLVVFSAAMGFMMAPGKLDIALLGLLILGGFLVTGAANGLNQILEREPDKLMSRTVLRPLPDNRMSVSEALIVCLLMGISGVFILTYYMNVLSGLLGLAAIVLYAGVYTPLKRVTPFAVFVGAIPGAIPPMLGWVAATGNIGAEGLLQFCIQFIWQFPHFWAIAWVLDEDYKKAGFNLLPTGQRDKGSALQTVLYTMSLVPLGIMPFVFGVSGWVSMIAILLITFYFTYKSWLLYRDCSIETAKGLMYASFLYLPVVQIAMVMDKL